MKITNSQTDHHNAMLHMTNFLRFFQGFFLLTKHENDNMHNFDDHFLLFLINVFDEFSCFYRSLLGWVWLGEILSTTGSAADSFIF